MRTACGTLYVFASAAFVTAATVHHHAVQPHSYHAAATICFVRHGESEWNAAKRFTGWTDVDLTDGGREEAATGGEALLANGLVFDRAFTSELKRAQETLAILLHTSNMHSVPQMRHWRLNERHYGALQGKNKQDCVAEHGIEQVRLWRNSFDAAPPLVSTTSPAFPGNDPKYAGIPHELLPRGECLRDTLERCAPFWDEHVVPDLRAGHNVLIAAHGHSIRALVKQLDSLSDSEVEQLSIPNGVPLVYHLDSELKPIRPAAAARGGGSIAEEGGDASALSGYFLGDDEKLAAAATKREAEVLKH